VWQRVHTGSVRSARSVRSPCTTRRRCGLGLTRRPGARTPRCCCAATPGSGRPAWLRPTACSCSSSRTARISCWCAIMSARAPCSTGGPRTRGRCRRRCGRCGSGRGRGRGRGRGWTPGCMCRLFGRSSRSLTCPARRLCCAGSVRYYRVGCFACTPMGLPPLSPIGSLRRILWSFLSTSTRGGCGRYWRRRRHDGCRPPSRSGCCSPAVSTAAW
jgi:hypothetical protein